MLNKQWQVDCFLFWYLQVLFSWMFIVYLPFNKYTNISHIKNMNQMKMHFYSIAPSSQTFIVNETGNNHSFVEPPILKSICLEPLNRALVLLWDFDKEFFTTWFTIIQSFLMEFSRGLDDSLVVCAWDWRREEVRELNPSHICHQTQAFLQASSTQKQNLLGEI